MRKLRLLSTIVVGAMAVVATAQTHQFNIQANKLGAPVQPTMYGIFFEDINFGADGGLYAEMVENRSFEFPSHLMGWGTFGNVSVSDVKPAFERNPHYVTLLSAGHDQKFSGLENKGFFGMGVKKGMKYDFSVYARLNSLQGKAAKIRVEIVDSKDNPIDQDTITITNNQWKKFTASLTSKVTDAKALMRIFLMSEDGVDLDHISLFPSDNWHGLRADLVKDLEDLHPGVFRFPGGCIVEGTDLATRYQWKNSVGDAENRPLNENRWNYTFPNRMYPNYYQTYGLGFYEYFLLSEKIGAQALPVLSCGLACQFQNDDKDANAHVDVKDLEPYIQDALDLIEFANGATTTKWGKLRADMGHPAPFNLKQVAIGNEQWGKLYPERLEPFVKAIRAKYPQMKIVGTAGPSPDGKDFEYGWKEMKRLGADLVDEHYYRNPAWFLKNAGRYDNYDRKGPKVFAGEYACHVEKFNTQYQEGKNDFEAALSEAAFMTGLERNADIVHMATYAPLFAHVDGWQWRPDLIWFDNLSSVRSVNYYVQQLYGMNKGSNVLSLTENGKAVEGNDGLYASAVYDKSEGSYIVKVANTTNASKDISIVFNGLKKLSSGQVTTLHADSNEAANTVENKNVVMPQTADVTANGNILKVNIGARTFAVYKFKK
jgi:alpha-L-arabinofuranosidase